MLGVPSVLVALQPGWVPTSLFPCPMLPLSWLPKPFNRATYAALSATLRAYAGITNRWRTKELGLPVRKNSHDLVGNARIVLQAFSPLVTPVDPRWPDSVRTTGFWYLPSKDWAVPAPLAAFLADGPPPVYLGFGSMAGRGAQRTADVVADAVRKAGVRAVVATGWGGIAPDVESRDVLVIDQAPHDKLFPDMAAVVHHGGSGTTGAALAAGRPQVVCPFVADQPHWAARMHAVGVAPAPLRQQDLTADRLATRLAHVTGDPGARENAELLGARIRAENGVHAAVDALEHVL
jgi:sterol 3beta-glucosyltransferase